MIRGPEAGRKPVSARSLTGALPILAACALLVSIASPAGAQSAGSTAVGGAEEPSPTPPTTSTTLPETSVPAQASAQFGEATATVPAEPVAPWDAYYEARRLIAESGSAPASFSDSLLRPAFAGKPAASRFPDPSARILDLARIAFEGGEGLLRKEAGRLLVARLALGNDMAACVAAAEEFRSEFGPDRDISRGVLDIVLRCGDDDQILAAVAELRKIDPGKAEPEADFLAWTELYAKFRSGRPEWTDTARSYIYQRTTTAWGLRVLDLAAAADPQTQQLSARDIATAAMRAAVYRKNTWEAFVAIQPFLRELLVPSTNPALLSDIGKACLSSNTQAETAQTLGELASQAALAAAAEKKAGRYSAGIARTGWLAGYYRARLLQTAGGTDEASTLFMDLAQNAGNSGDLDSALWYWLDAAMKRIRAQFAAPPATPASAALPAATLAQPPIPPQPGVPDAEGASEASLPRKTDRELRREMLGAILEASSRWKNPSWYEDIVDPFFRETVIARDWDLLLDMVAALQKKSASTMANRMRYVAGRAIEAGLAGTRRSRPDQDPRDEAAAQSEALYRTILTDTDASLYYRALASWRLGVEIELVPAKTPPDAPILPETETEAFIAEFCERGLLTIAGSEAYSRAKDLANPQIERLASMLAGKGNIVDSVRLARLLVDRKDRIPRRSDYAALYPRPWLDIVERLLPESGVPESVFYGLIRSESLFNPVAVSRSGAMGLTQLMPPTAEETARKLGMSSYSVTRPEDNLRIGFRYYRSMVATNDGRLMRGMFAYNAGPGRMRRWAAAYPELPDDILLEILEYSETRQYGRNITQAALMYGALYEGRTSSDTLDLVVAGKRD